MCARGRFCSLISGLGVKFSVIIIAGRLFSPGEVVTAPMMGDGLIVLPGATDPSPGVSRINFFAVQGTIPPLELMRYGRIPWEDQANKLTHPRNVARDP